MNLITPHIPKPMRIQLPSILSALTALLFAIWPARLPAQVSGLIAIWPQNNTVELKATKQFGAYVPITPNTVNWYVNDQLGGERHPRHH